MRIRAFSFFPCSSHIASIPPSPFSSPIRIDMDNPYIASDVLNISKNLPIDCEMTLVDGDANIRLDIIKSRTVDLQLPHDVSFALRIPDTYPEYPPEVKCLTPVAAPLYNQFGTVSVAVGGQVHLPILDLDRGWSRDYNIACVVESIRWLFQRGTSKGFGGEVETIRNISVLCTSATCEMQGKRANMEDRVSAMDLVSGLPFDASFFAVFDGHGGTSTSDYLSKNYHTNLFSIMRRSSNIKECIKQAITQTEGSLVEDLRRDGSKSGSTAVSCLIAHGNIYTANLGDSRAVLSRRGVAIELSKDHKPGLPEEIARVVSVGGFVTRGRVLGSLAVSRAFGDIDFKSATSETCCVSPEADLTVTPITPDDEFLILACDGLWDVMTSQQVVDYVAGAIRSYGDINRIATNLVEHAINTLGTTDNVSLIIVKLKMKQGDSDAVGITTQRSSSSTQQIASSFASGSTSTRHDDFDDADDFSGSVLDDLLRETSDTERVKPPLSIGISRGAVVKDAGGAAAAAAPPQKGAVKDDHDLDLEFLMNDENFK